mmetsp:Transcript_11250/g.23976  ORF Transcript_11250/g.23976 Transcript_11250/m.23976 type:complete len:347 (+) Transcript_11250:1076-2116(+)
MLLHFNPQPVNGLLLITEELLLQLHPSLLNMSIPALPRLLGHGIDLDPRLLHRLLRQPRPPPLVIVRQIPPELVLHLLPVAAFRLHGLPNGRLHGDVPLLHAPPRGVVPLRIVPPRQLHFQLLLLRLDPLPHLPIVVRAFPLAAPLLPILRRRPLPYDDVVAATVPPQPLPLPRQIQLAPLRPIPPPSRDARVVRPQRVGESREGNLAAVERRDVPSHEARVTVGGGRVDDVAHPLPRFIGSGTGGGGGGVGCGCGGGEEEVVGLGEDEVLGHVDGFGAVLVVLDVVQSHGTVVPLLSVASFAGIAAVNLGGIVIAFDFSIALDATGAPSIGLPPPLLLVGPPRRR